MDETSTEFLDFEAVVDLLDPHAMVYLLIVVAVLWLSRRLFDAFAPYDLNRELTELDNKAVALSFGGYLAGVGIVLHAVLSGEAEHYDPDAEVGIAVSGYFTEVALSVAWSLGAIVLLLLARLANDRLILGRFSNVKEAIEDQNLGIGAAECGTYVGSALIMHGALSGDSAEPLLGAGLTLMYFVIGQVIFVAFGALYGRLVRFDLHEQLEADNAAAGVSLGMSLVAVALLLSGFIAHSASLPGVVAWSVLSAFLLVVTRYLVDKLMLPGQLLDEEVATDRNWGAALVEGSSAIIVAAVVNLCFL